MLGKVVVCADGEAACRPEGQLNRLWQNPGQSGWEFEVAGFKPNDDDRKWAQTGTSESGFLKFEK